MTILLFLAAIILIRFIVESSAGSRERMHSLLGSNAGKSPGAWVRKTRRPTPMDIRSLSRVSLEERLCLKRTGEWWSFTAIELAVLLTALEEFIGESPEFDHECTTLIAEIKSELQSRGDAQVH